MGKSALVIGGSGQIGRAVCALLAAEGWRVTAVQRHDADVPEALRSAGVQAVAADRSEPGALRRVIGAGVDALIDTVAYDEGHAGQLLEVQGDVGAFVVVSSASVYRDARGRSLDEARETGFPDLPVPIGEDQPTVEPGPATYSTRKMALEQSLLQTARRPVTILRPGAIHGEGSRHPREWWFVRRILDGRRQVPLAWRGESRFHTSATANIAELCRVALLAPSTAVLNAADPEALTVRRIGEVVASVYSHDWRLIPLEGPPAKGVGGHPWAVERPIVLDMGRAATLGYQAVVRYEGAAPEACRSAVTMARAGAKFPDYLLKMFDYAAEDVFLSERS